ncbi:MAG: PorP/SprF family type IX secretion system membrane protein, partial [Flavobacterium sp.]|nr:PorP/SprF family type IX secretion system membrane protein [Flavobacterium sp.]
MKKNYLLILFLLLNLQAIFSQSTGFSSFDLPAKNSIKFNKYLINPAFSFVREEFAVAAVYNKSQFSAFENAPQTILGGYTGKFQENNSFGIAGFQQNFGLLTTTGGVLNYARNAIINDESNFTFALNIGIYKSGINTSKIQTNAVDPLLATLTNSTVISINPGINYGSGQIDFGVSANNLVLYNLSDSKTVATDPEKSFQGHFMFTGFVDSYGIFDESKFTTLIRAENKKAKTVVVGLFAFEMPSIGWLQVGYSNLNGASAGLGFNILKNFSVGYNYEKTLGDAASLGISHEFSLAYTFKDSDNNDSGVVYVKPTATIEKTVIEKPKPDLTAKEIADAKAKAIADATAAKLLADKILKDKIAADAKTLADAKAKAIADAAAAKIEADKLLKDKTNSNSKALADAKAKAAADAIAAKALADKLLKDKAMNGAKALADARVKAAADAAAAKIESDRLIKEKLLADTKAKAAADAALAKAEADKKLKDKTLTNAQILAEAKAKAAADALVAKAEANRLLKEKEILGAKAITDAKAKALANAAAAKLEADRLLKEKGLNDDKSLADAKAKALAEAAAAKAETDRILKEKTIADAKTKSIETPDNGITEAKIKADANAKAKADADKLIKDQVAAEAKIKVDAAAKAKLESDKAKAGADKILKDKLVADAKAKADADKLIKDQTAAEAKIKADTAAKAKLESEKAKA